MTLKNNINYHIGQKIRERRNLLGMNQTDLGNKIGVTFQQIQKYEKGHNNIVASKLYEMAKQLDVPITYFFDNLNNPLDLDPNTLMAQEAPAEFNYTNDTTGAENSNREAITIVKIYNNIHSKEVKKKLLSFLKTLASDNYDG